MKPLVPNVAPMPHTPWMRAFGEEGKHEALRVIGSSQVPMILPTYPGKIPQTSPNPQKRKKFLHKQWVKNVRGIFQGYVGGILDTGI